VDISGLSNNEARNLVLIPVASDLQGGPNESAGRPELTGRDTENPTTTVASRRASIARKASGE